MATLVRQSRNPQILNEIQVKAEPYVTTNDARLSAAIIETQLYQQLKQQSVQLEQFRKSVNERLRKQKHEKVVKESAIVVEKHDNLLKGAYRNDIPINDDHEVRIINCSEDIDKGVQMLLSACPNKEKVLPEIKPSLKPVQYKEPHNVKTSFKTSLKSGKTVTLKPCHTLSENEQKLMERKEVAAHNLAVRRMYSALERQQCRVNAHNRQQHVAAERRKKEREEERRQIETLYEEEYQSENDREEAKEWLEMVALERRHQKLLKQKETERFCEALKFQLHEKHPDLPPLCTCHTSIWETDPSQCARNCPYYNNPNKFVKDLSSLLGSVKLNS